MLTATELRSRLEYIQDTGLWIWISSPRLGFNGRPAGWIDAHGYRRIKIDGMTYIGSRLAYLYMIGRWPENEIDHIDGNPGTDCCSLFPDTTLSRTSARGGLRVDVTSGVCGVEWH